MTDQQLEFISRSVDETIALGRVIGQNLSESVVIALIGPLGTGKTHLIKGLAQGLDVADDYVLNSPTFTLINEYEGRWPFYHVDAYRLADARQLEALGFDEICSGAAIVAVEWADRVWPLVQTYEPICLYLQHQSHHERIIRLQNLPGRIADKISTFPKQTL